MDERSDGDVIIIGAGIGGLTLALALHQAGIACRIYEAAPQIRPIGVGINVLPHGMAELARLGLEPELAAEAVSTQESAFFNRFGQLIWREPAGRAAGFAHPQLSIHRGDLQMVLLRAVQDRLGPDLVLVGWECIGADQAGGSVTANFRDRDAQHGRVLVGCDGIRSVIRRQFYPREGPPRYSGYNMWRGVTVSPPFLTGATMVRAGWLATGKMVIYPIRNHVDAEGRQLINWVAEIETPQHQERDWNRPGRLQDFLPAFADWRFDWLDVPAMISAAEMVLEFPMVDQDPLPRWSFGRITLLGDAAHPMVPRGSNGAGQAILDARALADSLAAFEDPVAALAEYESLRLEPTAKLVLMNRQNPPDAILREVFLRTGDRPFRRIEDVITEQELRALSENYKTVAGLRRSA
jgi:2-polyprenyl-6-methoxyphenol hydroxylase-like FAD-dependent oxidoreductase